MRILVTNDDGVNAEGLWSLAESLQSVGSVTVVAPDRDQSGVGAGMSLTSVVRAQQLPSRLDGVKSFAVEGTPADCVILACEELIAEPIDLVVSGINQGSNLGMDVVVSGTIGAALHGHFHGIPSIAVSVAYTNGVVYGPAAAAARSLAEAIVENSVGPPLLLNVNVPSLPQEAIRSVELTVLGPSSYLENVQRGTSGRRTYYWIRHDRAVNPDVPRGSDIWAVRDNRISITPMEVSFAMGRPPPSMAALADAVSAGLRATH